MKTLFILLITIFSLVFTACDQLGQSSDEVKAAAVDLVLEKTVEDISATIFSTVGLPLSLSNVSANVGNCSDGTLGRAYISTTPIIEACDDGGSNSILSYDYCDTASEFAEDYIISFTASSDSCATTISFDDCESSKKIDLEISGDIEYSYNKASGKATVIGSTTISIGELEDKTCEFNVVVANPGLENESYSGTMCELNIEDLESLEDDETCNVLLSDSSL